MVIPTPRRSRKLRWSPSPRRRSPSPPLSASPRTAAPALRTSYPPRTPALSPPPTPARSPRSTRPCRTASEESWRRTAPAKRRASL